MNSSKPLLHVDDNRLSVALAFRAVLAEKNSTSKEVLVPALHWLF
jgi:hypothetical protein